MGNINEYNQQQLCEQKECGCPIPDLSAACVIYKGDELTCIGAEIPENLEVLLKKFDTAICNKLNTILEQGGLVNVGSGIEFYKGTNNLGQREIRTLTSSDGSIIINLDPNNEEVDITFDGQTFTLERESTTADVQIVSEYDSVNNQYTFKGLKSLNNDLTITEDVDGNITFDINDQNTFLNTITVNGDELIFGMNNGVNLTADLSLIGTDTYLDSASFDSNSGIITLTLNDGSTIDVDISSVNSQVKSDFLEEDSNSFAFIENKNPQKYINGTTDFYSLTPSDNNYTIVVDTSNQPVQIDVGTNISGVQGHYFVGFIQKGENPLTFLNYDVKPENYDAEMLGEGFAVAVEKIKVNSTQYEIFLMGDLKRTIN